MTIATELSLSPQDINIVLKSVGQNPNGKHYLIDRKRVEDALKVKSDQLQFIQHNQDQNVNLGTLVEQFLFALHNYLTKYLFVKAIYIRFH